MENNIDVKREKYKPMPMPMPVPVPLPAKPIMEKRYYSKQVEIVEPCVYAALKNLRGQKVCVTTTCGKYRGQLLKVKPDHIVICEGRCVHFIRCALIVAVTPEPKC